MFSDAPGPAVARELWPSGSTPTTICSTLATYGHGSAANNSKVPSNPLSLSSGSTPPPPGARELWPSRSNRHTICYTSVSQANNPDAIYYTFAILRCNPDAICCTLAISEGKDDVFYRCSDREIGIWVETPQKKPLGAMVFSDDLHG